MLEGEVTQSLLEGRIGQPVRLGVLPARYMANAEPFEGGGQPLHLEVQRLEGGVSNPVAAVYLLYHQLRVEVDISLAGAQLDGFFQGGDNRPVFRLVVGGTADWPRKGGKQPPLTVLDGGADSGLARVAPRGAVGVYY